MTSTPQKRELAAPPAGPVRWNVCRIRRGAISPTGYIVVVHVGHVMAQTWFVARRAAMAFYSLDESEVIVTIDEETPS